MTQSIVALAAWPLNLYILGKMFLKEILRGGLNCRYLFKNMDTKSVLNLKLKLCLTKKGPNSSSVLDKTSRNGERKPVNMPLIILVTM